MKRRNTALFRYEMPDKEQKPYIAMDMETMPISETLNANGFLYGAAHRSDDAENDITYFDTLEQIIEYLLHKDQRGYVAYFHNGANFDFKFLVPILKEYAKTRVDFSFEMVMQGATRCIALILRYSKHKIEIRDSYALIPEALKKLSAKFAPEYEKKNIGLNKGVLFDKTNPVHLEYLKYDILGLEKVIAAFRDIVEDHFAVHLGRTTAATAMRAWRATLPVGHVHFRSRHSVEDMAYMSYYGGRIYLRDIEFHSDVVAYDVNSMYPNVMRQNGVPTGPAAYTKYYVENKPGIYKVMAHVPQSFTFPLVPERTKFGTRFRTGDIPTYITSMEIEKAKEYGCTFDIIEGYVWSQCEHIFDEFVDKCETLRLQYKGSPVETATKLIANAAYGKFGTKRWVESYLIIDEPTKEEVQKRGLTPYTYPNGSVSADIWVERKELDVAYIQPHWAAWITAGARLHLFAIAEQIGLENVLYTDTDSVFCERRHGIAAHLDEGIKFGQVKLDKEMSLFIAGGLKMYAGLTDISEKYPMGEIVCCKGTPLKMFGEQFTTFADIVTAIAGEGIAKTFVRSNSTKAVVHNDASYFQLMTRRLSYIGNSQNIRLEKTRVLPLHMEMVLGT